MSESCFHCFKCPQIRFSNLLEAVKHVIRETPKGKGSKGVHVRCCVEGCLKSVRKSKLRLHIRKSHTRLCPVPCLDCQAKFVEHRDLDNHRRNGCPRRKQTEMIAAAVPWSTDRECHTRLIGKHKVMAILITCFSESGICSPRNSENVYRKKNTNHVIRPVI